MSDWNLFVYGRPAGLEIFGGTRSLAVRSLSRGAGSKQCRQESGRRIDFKNSPACAWLHIQGGSKSKLLILSEYINNNEKICGM